MGSDAAFLGNTLLAHPSIFNERLPTGFTTRRVVLRPGEMAVSSGPIPHCSFGVCSVAITWNRMSSGNASDYVRYEMDMATKLRQDNSVRVQWESKSRDTGGTGARPVVITPSMLMSSFSLSSPFEGAVKQVGIFDLSSSLTSSLSL